MSIAGDTPRENLTLTEADLAACRPLAGEGGHVLRARCPFHGSDQRLLPIGVLDMSDVICSIRAS